MKVLLILTSIEVGTIEKVSYNLYKTLLKEKDVELYVVNLKSSDKDFYKLENLYNIEECRSKNFFVRQIYNIRKVFKLRKIKRKVKPDISITTQEAGTTINLLGLTSERKIGIFHAPYHQAKSQGILSYYLQFLSYKILYSRLDHIYCVSKEIKRSILQSFQSISASKLKVVYNIHDFEDIKQKSEEELNEDENFIFNNGKVIVYVGRFDENKAPDRLIKAYYRLSINKKIAQNIKLLLIGDGGKEYLDYLKRLVVDFELNENVVFLGFKSNPYKYIKRSTILVSTSISEGLPGVLIEAMFLKIPIVATNSSLGVWEILDCSEKFDNELPNLYVAPNGIITSNLTDCKLNDQNLLNLEVAIEKLLNDEEFYLTIKNNHSIFLKLLDKKQIVKKFIKP